MIIVHISLRRELNAPRGHSDYESTHFFSAPSDHERTNRRKKNDMKIRTQRFHRTMGISHID